MKFGAIGMVFGKVTNGLTPNFFSELYYPFQLDEDGTPKVSVQSALGAINYCLSDEIRGALVFLEGENWLDENVKIETVGIEPLDEVQVTRWLSKHDASHVWNSGARVDFTLHLEDIIAELELGMHEYTREWYYAKISHLYFSDYEIPQVAMNIGILLSQMWWKLDLEEFALRGSANVEALERAKEEKKNRAVNEGEQKLNVILELWREARTSYGDEMVRKDSNAAHAIYSMALERRPKELTIKSTGKIVGAEAIRKHISKLRKLDKLG